MKSADEITDGLVGSEMCIRARDRPDPPKCRGLGRSSSPRDVERQSDRPNHAKGAVSYTHLTLPTSNLV